MGVGVGVGLRGRSVRASSVATRLSIYDNLVGFVRVSSNFCHVSPSVWIDCVVDKCG